MKATRWTAAMASTLLVLALPAGARTVDTDWWKVDFESPTPVVSDTAGGVYFEVGTLNGLTNKPNELTGINQPYASGEWKWTQGDLSYVTNAVSTNESGVVTNENYYLELNTYARDLTWQPTGLVVRAETKPIVLVDADILFRGSETAPVPDEFDNPTNANGRVQAAIYLKNETNELSEVTNSVLCVYTTAGQDNGWQELAGVEIEDGTWHHVRVQMDYTLEKQKYTTVRVFVDGTELHLRGGSASDTVFKAANVAKADEAGKINSVSFRGTGMLDNFTGRSAVNIHEKLDFVAEVWIDGELQDFDEEGNVSRFVSQHQAGDPGEKDKITFENFYLSDGYEWGEPLDATISLSKVEIVDFVQKTTNTVTFTRDPATGDVTTNAPCDAIEFEVDEDYGDVKTGHLSVTAYTDGAVDPTNVMVRLFFKLVGQFTLTGETYLDGVFAPALVQTNDYVASEITELDAQHVFHFPTTREADGVSYVLQRIPTNANERVSAPELSVDGSEVQVRVSLYGLENDLVAAQAYYVEGTFGDRKVVRVDPDETNGSYTFMGAVAMIDGETPAYYETLQGAVDACQAGQTVSMIADVRTTDETLVTNTVALDLNGHTITAGNTKGLTPDGRPVPSKRWIRITTGGDLTLTNSVPGTGAIVSDEYLESNPGCCLVRVEETGRFTMNGGAIVDTVSIPVDGDGDGEFDGEDDGAYVANAVGVFGTAVVTINGGSITASGYAVSLNGSAAGENYSDGATITINGGAITATMGTALYVPAGSVTVNGGTLTGLGGVYAKGGRLVFPADSTATVTATATADEIFEWAAMYGSGNQTGEALTLDNSNYTYGPTLATIAGGTFVSSNAHAVACYAVEGATMGSKFVTGGWFSDEVAASYLADGYRCVEDADPPTAEAPYTVKAASVKFVGDPDDLTYLSLAEALVAAEAVGTNNPTFVAVREIAAETFTLATEEALLTIQTEDLDFTTNVTVETSLVSDDATEYEVGGPYVAGGLGGGFTKFWRINTTHYVAKIADVATTNRYETFAEAAEAAAAGTPTLVVEMVANTNAVENYGLPAGYALLVKENGFEHESVESASRGHYVDASGPDADGVTTYTSKPWLTTRFLNGDDSEMQVDLVKEGQTPVPTFSLTDIEPYPPAEPGYAVAFAGSWTPALGPVSEDTDFRPNFTTNAIGYNIECHLDGIGGVYETFNPHWPDGFEPPNPWWYWVTNDTIELPAPEMDGWKFLGWYTNATGGAAVGDLVNPGVIPAGSHGTKSFYADWAEILNATFVTNSMVYTNVAVVAGETLARPDDPAPYTKDGWRFELDHWATNGAAGLAAVETWPQAIGQEAPTYYAVFASNAVEYTLAFEMDSETAGWGAIYLPPDTYTVTNENFSIPDPTNAPAYLFAGWTLTRLDGDAWDGDTPTTGLVIEKGTTGDRVYTATWSNAVFRIEYVLGGGTNAAANPDSYTVDSPDITLADPGREGDWEFAGWTEDGTSTNLVVTIPHGSTGDRSFTAVWTEKAVAEPEEITIGFDENDDPLPAGTKAIEVVDSGNDHTFTLRFGAKQTNVEYVLESSPDLNPENFTIVLDNGEPVADTADAVGDVIVLTDPDTEGANVRFYRVLIRPIP